MRPSKLYLRDYTVLNADERAMKEEYLCRQASIDILNIKPMNSYPVAVRHNLSLFPNNHIDLVDIKDSTNLAVLNDEFYQLLSKEKCMERDILNFINRTPAYHIVASILRNNFAFGHHELYLFKEMWLGKDYRTDYVLIGKGSGGYEFVLIEFENVEGRITLKDGHWGEAFRKGNYQVDDWRAWMDAHFTTFADDLQSVKGEMELPIELKEYDHTRFHYVVVAGRRSNFDPTTYRSARKMRSHNILMLHLDNLYDSSVELENAQSF